jgi:hypothetical protein
MSGHSPSEKQLNYLNTLGYAGIPPLTISNASVLIDCMKDGLGSEHAQRQMLFERATGIEKVNLYLAELGERKKLGYECAGWRLKVKRGNETQSNKIYDGAFLPFSVGKQYPEILAISGLENDRVLHQKPKKGPIVFAPNEIGEID